MPNEILDADSTFWEILVASDAAVWKVARYFYSRGQMVTLLSPLEPEGMNDPRRAPRGMLRRDGGDLGVTYRVEVKQRQIDFTSAEDFPFSSVFVCQKHKWDCAFPRPLFIVHVNKAGTHVAIVRGATSPRWFLQSVRDKRFPNDAPELVYCAHKGDVEFQELKDSPCEEN